MEGADRCGDAWLRALSIMDRLLLALFLTNSNSKPSRSSNSYHIKLN